MRDVGIDQVSLGAARTGRWCRRLCATAWHLPLVAVPAGAAQGPSIADGALAGKPDPYRRLDTRGTRGAHPEGRAGHDRGTSPTCAASGYSRSLDDRVEAVESGGADAGFFMRATPMEQVRAVAVAGESMPPKSTYFYPKIPTGLVFKCSLAVKIYTRKGDDGTTGLWYGGPGGQDAPRTEAYGAVDEAASALGLARALWTGRGAVRGHPADPARAVRRRRRAATASQGQPSAWSRACQARRAMVERLEADIDRYMDRCGPAAKFVIPGGSELSARLDVARAGSVAAPSGA